jgi:hypothetical protein
MIDAIPSCVRESTLINVNFGVFAQVFLLLIPDCGWQTTFIVSKGGTFLYLPVEPLLFTPAQRVVLDSRPLVVVYNKKSR